ncbi:sugar phosphate isomerase/epimerase family protein [Halovenus sp. HT40]|uniref:sugar phosphate isomerase/epimerase family protein n=1 Tax=Halovenus sp. HT40 TaxID=3126691 RepID=UPI00300EC451
MRPNRRDILKATGGTLTVAGIGQASAQEDGDDEAEEDADEEETDTDDGAPLLASMWAHGIGATPFRGAHGHRNWSVYPIEQRARILSEVGFEAIGFIQQDIRHILEYELTEPNSRRGRLQQLNSILEQNGIDFVELEFLTEFILDEDDPRRQAEQDDRELLLEAAEVLDANHLKIGNINGYPVEMEDIQDRFLDVSEEFADVGTEVGLEFFPVDPNIQSISEALEATSLARDEGVGGLYLDLWHNVKLDVDFDEIADLDADDDIVAVEFNDGYVETDLDFLEETINLRKLPGEGEFDIEGWIDALDSAGFEGPYGLEILSEEYRRFEPEEAYQRAYDAGAEYF